MPRGRPPLTEDVLRQRIADYCARYGVRSLNADGLPPYPAGQRESRQHREWIVLHKGLSRLRAREGLDNVEERERLHLAQKGRCPVCAQNVDSRAVLDRDLSGRVRGLVHRECARVLRMAEDAGAETVARVASYLWSQSSGAVVAKKAR